MTPTIVLKDGKLFMVLGSPGGPTIINTVLQAMLNVIDHGMGIQQAMDAPRIHHQWRPDRLSYERAFPTGLLDALRAKGHVLATNPGVLGDVQAVMIDSKSGERIGASDSRSSDGRAIGY